MSYGRVTKMSNYVYKTPNAGTLMDLETGLEYTFARESLSGVPTDWNIKLYDIVSFTISGTKATGVTLYKKHVPGVVYSYSS